MSDVRAVVEELLADVADQGVQVRHVARVPSLDTAERVGFELTTLRGNVVDFLVSPAGIVELV